ncbi:MAG: hypothetical protein AAGC95_05530 [Pseudomonadota bacterium]
MTVHLRFARLFFVGFILAGCASLDKDDRILAGSTPVCAEGVDLGAIYVTLVTDWRANQKAPEERKQMAEDVVNKALQELPCGDYKGFERAVAHTADTLIEITVREFGPELILSAPVLWSTNTDVDATIRVINARTRAEIFAASQRRKDGGAFAIKSLSAVPATFEDMLREWLVGPS